MKGKRIITQNKIQYLGIYLDRELRFNIHLQQTLNEAHSPITERQQLSIRNKWLLYMAVLRPIVTYAAPVWMCRTSKTSRQPLQIF